MKKTVFILLAVVFAAVGIASGQTAPQDAHRPDTDWFEEARFGMFVHFGPYSVLADGEWVMNLRPIVRDRYRLLQDIFNPQAFDAAEWVRIAKGAGMKYIILTSRHHDGFSNWATDQSDWNIMNTPYGKDIIGQLADECRKQGLKLGFYYSQIDWTRDDYQWRTGSTGKRTGRTAPSDWEHYIEFMKAQLTELLTRYGDVAVIWFDGQWEQPNAVDWHLPEIYELIHRLQPDCLIANNHHTTPFPGEDYQIFEQDLPGENSAGFNGAEIAPLPLETCMTMNGSWGFNITDDKYKSTPQLIHILVRAAGNGSNLLLNVGPRPDGRIEQEATKRLAEMGEWLEDYGHTIYGTKKGWVSPQKWGAVTRSGDTYYIHILDGSEGTLTLNIPGFRGAKWLNVAGEIDFSRVRRTDEVTFKFSAEGLDPTDSIIEVKVK